MDLLFKIYAVLVTAGIVVFLGAIISLQVAHSRRQGWDRTLSDRYLRLVIFSLTSDHAPQVRLPLVGRSGSRMVLSGVIAGLMTATYGLDIKPLRGIVMRCGLGDYLLRYATRNRGYQRAYALSLLSRLPVEDWVAAKTICWAADRNRYVRFYSLLTQLSHDQTSALRRIANHPDRLNNFEISEILSLLQRAMVPMAYEPLLLSTNTNLQLVGLGIVRQCGIEQAERNLLRVVGVASADVGVLALKVLCSLKGHFSGIYVARRIAAMNPLEQRSLMRLMALEGYSVRLLRQLFGEQDRSYYESLIFSYKRALA